MRGYDESRSIMIDAYDCKYRFHDEMINYDSFKIGQKWKVSKRLKTGMSGHFWGSNVNKFNIFELISDNENQIIWRHY